MIKSRALAYAFVLAVCAGMPPAINAEEESGLAPVVMPATNLTHTAAEVQDPPLAIALAYPDATDTNSTSVNRGKRSPWPTPARFFTINQVIAKHGSAPSRLELASIRSTETLNDQTTREIPPTQGVEPFGLFTFKAPDGLVSLKWRKLLSDTETEAPILERCRTQRATCTPASARFASIIDDAAKLPLRAKLQLVNERVNGAIRYTEDWEQWHQSDVWSAPIDVLHKGSFETGMGDCEDYAIAKYVALREAGVPEHNLRVLLVRDQAVHLDHAVLAALDGGHWVILDNRWSRLSDDSELRQFVPLFALNHDGAKMFAAPYAAGPMKSMTKAHRAEPQPYVDSSLSNLVRLKLGAAGALPLLM